MSIIIIKEPTQLSAPTVRLVLPTGTIIVDKTEAISKALTDGMDLILVQEGDIPVVKLCDYTKIEYDKQKNIKCNKSKKSKQVKIGPHTHEHDMCRLAKQAMGFIEDGHSVTLRMEVKGRDRKFNDLLKKKIADFVAKVQTAKPGRISISEDGGTYMQALT